MTSLTIQVDDDLLNRARELAAARKMTVQEMLQRLLFVIAAPPLVQTDLPPLTRQALGLLPHMTDAEVRQALDDERVRKHGS